MSRQVFEDQDPFLKFGGRSITSRNPDRVKGFKINLAPSKIRRLKALGYEPKSIMPKLVDDFIKFKELQAKNSK